MDRDKVRIIVTITGVIITGVAVSATVGMVIKNIVPIDELTKSKKVLAVIGGGVLGGVAANAGSEYTSSIINNLFDNVYGIYDRITKTSETGIEVENPA